MAQFSYKARSASGELTEGVIEASDVNNAAQILLSRSITPIDIMASNHSGERQNSSISWLTPKVGLDDLVIFSRQMYSLTKSGIPILRAVNGLAETSNSKRMIHALKQVVVQLERGRNLSSALNQHPDIFNRLFVSVVHVGENTGKLDEAFAQLSMYLEREQETRKQIKAATRYPMFVVVALVIAMVVLNLVVIPIFASMFERLGSDLPPMTQFLLSMSNLFINYWPLMLLAVAGLIVGVNRYLKTSKGRYQWDKIKLRLPVVGSIFERSLLGRFTRSFAMMLRSGIPLTTALNLVAEAVSNAYMADKIKGMRRNIEKGESLTRVANSSQLFTPLVMQMLNVGEETGQLDELLTEVADYYEREVEYDLKSMTSKLEPILIVIVAAMVTVLALGIFTPMWDMIGAYQGK